jgi:hypothetical protein
VGKLIIRKSELPPVDSEYLSYTLRYRLVSDDKNKFSYWSPFFSVPIYPSYTVTQPSVSSVKISGTVVTANVAWNPVPGLTDYDIYIRWEDSSIVYDWNYYQTYSGTSITIPVPAGSHKFSVRIYQPIARISSAEAKDQSNLLKIYEKLDFVL